jgi:hypothetical protein
VSDLGDLRRSIPDELWRDGVITWPVAHLRQLLADASNAERASRASYAAGTAHGVDARPNRRQGVTVDP